MRSKLGITITMAVLVGLFGGCSDRDAGNAQSRTKEPERKDYIIVEGEIKRSIAMTMTQPGQMQAHPPDLTLVTTDGKEYEVRRMPGCTGGPPEASGGVIELGGLGRYRCKGVMAGSVFEVYEMTKL